MANFCKERKDVRKFQNFFYQNLLIVFPNFSPQQKNNPESGLFFSRHKVALIKIDENLLFFQFLLKLLNKDLLDFYPEIMETNRNEI
jgi:hypothetical protein